MNEYGALAMRHWQKWLPQRFSQIEDPTLFFSQLGEQVQDAIVETEQELEAKVDLAGLEYLETLGRLNAIRMQARELVLNQMVLLEPESPEGNELEDEAMGLSNPLAEWMDETGMPRDRQHPLWAMMEDENVSTEEFAAASAAWEDSLWQQVNPQA